MKPAEISDLLEKLFPEPAIPLKHENSFELLIAVMLSAQCTDERVNQISPKLFARAKTPAAMLELTREEIEKIIHPLGFFRQKTQSILAICKDLVEKHSSIVPQDFKALESLRGVGHKTASVVMSQAFNVPAFPIDTHIFRCARRWRLSKSKTVEGVERDLKAAFPEDRWIKLHLQIIYFARKYCPARGHDNKACPICSKLV